MVEDRNLRRQMAGEVVSDKMEIGRASCRERV